MKQELKEKAIQLRKGGLSYSEIRKLVPVAKSTLSLWFKSVKLSKPQQQRITQKRLNAALRGAEIKRMQRIQKIKAIQEEVSKEVGVVTQRELWLLGIALYWAEGTKEKEHTVGQPVQFNNSDTQMIKLFILWLRQCMKISDNDMKFEIYIHEKAPNVKKAIQWWSEVVGCQPEKFRIYFKRHNPKTNRRNSGRGYYGLLRIVVKESSTLNRKIAGAVQAICKNWGIV